LIIFSHPKPFRPETTAAQVAAFRSWKQAFPEARILLFGEEEGTKKTCADLGLEYAGPVRTEPGSGAALVSDMFQRSAAGKGRLHLFINSDILLGAKASRTVARLDALSGPWLASGRRYRFPALFEDTGAANREAAWEKVPCWGDVSEMDYFLYKNHEFVGMPDFTIGHCAWDNWMIWHARNQNIPVIDLSKTFHAYHFDHDYEYSRGNSSPWKRAGPLEEENLRLLGGEARRFHLGHATHEVGEEGIRRRRGSGVWQRECELFRLKHPRLEVPIRQLRNLFHPLIRRWEKSTRQKEDWNFRQPQKKWNLNPWPG
jgi:hypothetical protein